MDDRQTTHEKACRDLCRRGVCRMECIGSGRRWCAAVYVMVDGRRGGGHA